MKKTPNIPNELINDECFLRYVIRFFYIKHIIEDNLVSSEDLSKREHQFIEISSKIKARAMVNGTYFNDFNNDWDYFLVAINKLFKDILKQAPNILNEITEGANAIIMGEVDVKHVNLNDPNLPKSVVSELYENSVKSFETATKKSKLTKRDIAINQLIEQGLSHEDAEKVLNMMDEGMPAIEALTLINNDKIEESNDSEIDPDELLKEWGLL